MAHAITSAVRVQASCARDCTEPLADGRTVAAKLRELYATEWCALSIGELADRFGVNRRTIQLAHVELCNTYGPRFEVVPQTGVGRALLPMRRRILPIEDHRVAKHSRISLNAHPLLTLGSLDLGAIAARALTPRAPSKSSAPPKKRRSSSPHRTHELAPELLAPLGIERGVSAALELRHGKRGLLQVLRVLREPACHERPAEARLAARTVANRRAAQPGALFRVLFKHACDGDTLIERDAEAARIRAAEAAELAKDPLRAPRGAAPPSKLAVERDFFVDADWLERELARAGPEPPEECDLSGLGAGVDDWEIPF